MLMCAAAEGTTASVKLLVEYNADVNAKVEVRSVCMYVSVLSGVIYRGNIGTC